MTRIIILIVILLNSHLVSGCIFNSDSPELKDAGTYTLKAEKKTLQSVRNGGGLFIINTHLNAELTTSVLSLDKLVAELVVKPDSLIALENYTIKVISEHSGVKNELDLYVEITQPIGLIEEKDFPYLKFFEFVEWIKSEYSIIVFEEGEELFSFFEYPIRSGSTFYFLSSGWETKITAIMTYPVQRYYYLRKRGEEKITLAAKKVNDNQIIEIPIEEGL